MAELKLSYAWSNSRIKLYRECQWRYYLYYILSFNGWLSNAPPDKKKAYLLKNMVNMPIFVGSVVHDIIEEVIKTARRTGKWPTLKESQDKAIQALRRGWKQSVDKKWEQRVKGNINLSENYYKREIPADKLKSYKQKVLKSLKAFYDCPLFAIMQKLSSEDWLTIEDFAKFKLNTGEEVVVKIDVGFRYDNKVFLLDWKTGKVDDDAVTQLTNYAMYALKQKWTKTLKDIVIVPVYLAAYEELGDKAIPHLEVTMEHIKRQAGIIRNEYPLLVEAFENRDNPDYFKKTDNENVCDRCFMRDMCSRSKREIEDGETPF